MNETEVFAALAKEYCGLIEQHQQRSACDLLQAVHRLLPKLYSAAFQLEPVGEAHSVEGLELTHDEWNVLFMSLQGRIGIPSLYREVFDPYAPLEEPVLGDLADDLADIYRDLKNGLWLWEQGHGVAAAQDWQENFHIHWSEHASGALRALRWLEFGHGMRRSDDDLAALLGETAASSTKQ